MRLCGKMMNDFLHKAFFFKTKTMKKHIFLAIFFLMILSNLSLQAQPIGMRVPDSTVVAGNTIDIPVYADNTLTGRNVLAYLLQLSFNQSYLQLISVVTTGTISAALGSPAVNTTVPGQVTIAGAGTAPLTGSGKFIYIRFKGLIPGGITINFTGAQNNYFNEGTPAMGFTSGYITVTSPPFITISPNSGIITKGETMQFNVSGGATPYQWFVTNSSAATINSTGLLTGTQPGFTKAVVVDNNGLRDTTNAQIEIRAMRLSIPTNLSQLQGTDINIPVNTTDLTGLNILSGNFSFTFNQNILTPVGVVQTGSLLASYSVPVFNTIIPGTISLDFAGSMPLSGSGTLIYITFHVSLVNTGSSSLSFISGLFNETYLPNFTDGYFSTINLPVLSITPSTGTLVAGQTKQFTLNGSATPPIVWIVSDPSIASISQTGLMTTLKGGNVTVNATDFHGAFANSGNWLIYDTQIIMADTTTCPAASDFYYPIIIKSLPSGESVSSVQGIVTYNSNYLTFQNIETNGTLTQGWTFASNNATPGNVSFAGSGTSSFNTPGEIIYLRFLLNPTFIVGSYASLQLTAVMLNEGVPNPLVDINGYLGRVNQSQPLSISVSASANPSISGSPVIFTATPTSGGPWALFQWRVNGSDISGATNSTFTYIPANSDAITCILTSTAVCITGNPATSNTITMTVVLPTNITVTGIDLTGQSLCHNATSTITVAGGGTTFTVQSGSSETMIAGQNIDYLPGTKVFPGGYMHGYIAPAGPYCIPPPPLTPKYKEKEEPIPGSPQPLFSVYPNPTNSDFTVSIDPSNAKGKINIEIFGIQGGKLMSVTLINEFNHVFSLSDRKSGIYFIRVNSGNRIATEKVIRQ